MGWDIGFEPMSAGITIRCVNPFANPTVETTKYRAFAKDFYKNFKGRLGRNLLRDNSDFGFRSFRSEPKGSLLDDALTSQSRLELIFLSEEILRVQITPRAEV